MNKLEKFVKELVKYIQGVEGLGKDQSDAYSALHFALDQMDEVPARGEERQAWLEGLGLKFKE